MVCSSGTGHPSKLRDGGRIDMTWVIASVLMVPVVVLIFGAVTGRIRVSSCCSVADPSKDLRMRGAFGEDPHDERSGRG